MKSTLKLFTRTHCALSAFHRSSLTFRCFMTLNNSHRTFPSFTYQQQNQLYRQYATKTESEEKYQSDPYEAIL